ncbi:MAG: DUF5104 domain-containing protein, partial [Oscillospiraceae bacterium]|nr:DUF5104 domain-containing protein [Oscillospiraceae bacterium]
EQDSVQGEKNVYVYEEIGKERWGWDDSPSEECAVNVMDCFINEDVEGLKKLFCYKVNHGTDLDKEITEAFEFIDGNIISYDDDSSCTSRVAYDEGKAVERYYCPFVDNITTDKNKVYTMNIGLYTVYEKDDGYVGVDAIVIRNSNGDKIVIGRVP